MMPRIDRARDLAHAPDHDLASDLDRAHALASALAWSLGADLG